jgi:hypothetical protein
MLYKRENLIVSEVSEVDEQESNLSNYGDRDKQDKKFPYLKNDTFSENMPTLTQNLGGHHSSM